MTIHMDLSTESINNVISQLQKLSEDLDVGIQTAVQALVKEGTIEAQGSTGGMATIEGHMVDNYTGTISESGKAALIAEFGAGDATIEPDGFENSPATPVFRGSYSLLVGSMEYWLYRRWHFGGVRYTEVQPRMGLYNAKQYIIANAGRVLQEVFRY